MIQKPIVKQNTINPNAIKTSDTLPPPINSKKIAMRMLMIVMEKRTQRNIYIILSDQTIQ